MRNRPYEIIEHTADIGIRVKGKDLKELFKSAALAMFDFIAEPQGPKARHTTEIKIQLESGNVEELFVDWLNELLFLSATKELIFSDFEIKELDKNNLQATASGANNRSYRINAEVKAATYHQLKIAQAGSGWQAEVIFDV